MILNLNPVFKSFLVASFMLTTSACSLRERKSNPSVSVTLPQEWVSAVKRNKIKTIASTTEGTSGFSKPTSLADFQCFALNVKGPGILPDPRFGCDNPSAGIGIMAGFIPVTQGSLDLMVPAGTSRVVQLIGVQSSIGCPSFNELLSNQGTDSFKNSIGEPYLLGETTIDIFDDTSATIVAAFNADKLAFSGCRNQSSNSSTASGPPTIEIQVEGNSPFIQKDHCSRVRLYARNSSGLHPVTLLPSIGFQEMSDTSNVYSDSGCEIEFNTPVTLPTPYDANSNPGMDFYVKSTATLGSSFGVTATVSSNGVWAVNRATFKTVNDRLEILGPNHNLFKENCVAITINNYSGPANSPSGSLLSSGSLNVSIHGNNNTNSPSSTRLYSNNSCDVSAEYFSTTSGNMRFYELNTPIPNSSQMVWAKSSVNERGYLIISRSSGDAEPFGIGFEFGSAPVITEGQNLSFDFGTPKSTDLSVSGSGFIWCDGADTGALPSGLSWIQVSGSNKKCTISGTPAEMGAFTIPVVARNNFGGSVATSVTITVQVESIRDGGGITITSTDTSTSTSTGVATIASPTVTLPIMSPFFSNSTSLTLEVNCQPNAIVNLSKDPGTFTMASGCPNSGTVTLGPITESADGVYALSLTQSNGFEASNASVFLWNVDRTAPVAPQVLSHGNNFTSSIGSLVLSGSCEAGATVEIMKNGWTIPQTVICSDFGTFSFSLSEFTSNTPVSHVYSLKQTDKAGNYSSSTSFTWNLSAGAMPPVVLSEPISNPFFSNADSIGIRGTCSFNATAVTLSGLSGTSLALAEVTSSTGTISMSATNAVMQAGCSSGQFLFVVNKTAVGTYQFTVTQTVSGTVSSPINVRWEKSGWVATSTVNAPVARTDHTGIWSGSEMIVWGGGNSGGNTVTRLNSGAKLNPVTNTWTPISLSSAPLARRYHSAVWTGSEMIVWGGDANTGTGSTTNIPTNTGARYHPVSDTWTPISTTGAPIARINHQALWLPTIQKMLVWGGSDATSSTFYNTGALYHPATDTWSPMTINSAPSARMSFTMVLAGSKVIVFGGEDLLSSYLNTGGIYDPVNNSWSSMSTTGAPLVRNHAAVWTGSEMLVTGGYDASGGVIRTTKKYNPATDSWTTLSNAITARQNSSAVWTGTEMMVCGGLDTITIGTCEAYKPVTNMWVSASSVGAPTARQKHTAIWTGTKMIIWGGSGNTGSVYNSGGIY